ncbi:MAG TPA: dipeptidase [Tepidisphaeraceae bacterium]|nr:dipeptidase [Tepidisphaeraceae bacterium]
MLDHVLQLIESRRNESVAGLKELLRIPSISAQPEHASDVKRCAEFLAKRIEAMGLWARVEPTAGHPIVVGGTPRKAGRPTVLLYGHYDVQPPEPLEQWITPPFEPTERNGALYARGAVDDKGQIWAHIEAIRAWQQHGGLPVNVIILLEGEEEVGSDNLATYLRTHKADLAADICVISDTGQFARGLPAITYGLRGLVYTEVFITGPSHDLHSGMYGGAVPNPANVLVELLATLHNHDGRVNIPGFYDDVVPLTPAERRAYAHLPFDEVKFREDLKLPGLSGEAGYTAIERIWARPTCDINGLSGGYQGPGAKTIIPAKASAKVSMRLVPNQDPQKIEAAFMQAMRERCPSTVKIEFAQHSRGAAALVPLEGPAIKLADNAVKTGFGVEPVFIRDGGSIPVVGDMKSILGLDTLLVGFGLPDDRVHSPNEKFDLDALYQGTRTAAALYEELSKLG